MKIIFTEARELLGGRIVAEGEEVDLDDGQAFIDNGVAKAAAPAKATQEVKANG